MNRTPIEWTHWSVNAFKMRMPDGTLINVCIHKSEGCRFCYAEGIVRRWWNKDWGEFPGYTAALLKIGTPVLVEAELQAVLRLNERISKGKADPEANRVFWHDMTDEYLEFWPDEFLDRVWAVRSLTPHLIHQVLTKRADRLRRYFSDPYHMNRARTWALVYDGDRARREAAASWPLPNAHIGTSVEDQKTADERIPLLLQTPAAVRWISAEPLLGPVDLAQHLGTAPNHEDLRGLLNWVVCGGESGPQARPMHPEWARQLRDQCVPTGVPFFFKQWGQHEYAETGDPREQWFVIDATGKRCSLFPNGNEVEPRVCARIVGKKAAGRLLDGREWSQYPRVSNEQAISATAGTL